MSKKPGSKKAGGKKKVNTKKRKIERERRKLARQAEGGSKLTEREKEMKKYTCAICMDLMTNPVELSCSHPYCKECLLAYVKSQIEFDPSNIETEGKKGKKKEAIIQKIKCPMCKAECEVNMKNMRTSDHIAKEIGEEFKQEYEAKKKEKKTNKKNVGTLLVGNKHTTYEPRRIGSKVGTSTHKWCVFVKFKKSKFLPSDLKLKKVQFELHRDFGIGKINVFREPWQVERKGYGEFTVKIWVHFDRKYRKRPVHIKHELSFKNSGKYREIDIDFGDKL